MPDARACSMVRTPIRRTGFQVQGKRKKAKGKRQKAKEKASHGLTRMNTDFSLFLSDLWESVRIRGNEALCLLPLLSFASFAFFLLPCFSTLRPAMFPTSGICRTTGSCASGYRPGSRAWRSEEHTSELQSHSFISYAVFC